MFEFINKRCWYADGERYELYPFMKIEFVHPALRGGYRRREQRLSAEQGGAVATQPEQVEATTSKADAGTQRRSTFPEPAFVRTEPRSNLKPVSKSTPTSGSTNLPNSRTGLADEPGSTKTFQLNRDPKTEEAALDTSITSGEVVNEAPLSEISANFKEKEVISGIVKWLRTQEPEPSHWKGLLSCAMARTGPLSWLGFRPYPRPTEGLTFDLLLQECRPGKLPSSDREKPHFLADWMIEGLRHVYRNSNQIREVLKKAVDVGFGYQLKHS